ncbi:MAG: hypothetical protein GX339_00675 [Tissierellia bacterium]|nr:hypothetical protein [Tissierellia bacterium]
MLGGNYAPSDILEMTSWVARYWPSDEEFCRVTRADGKVVDYNTKEFLRKCNQRAFTERQLKTIDRVDIGVKNNRLNFSIIDAPGFGSVNPANENRLINAISEADIIFWVLSCEVIGGMREAAFIQHFKDTNTPYICILTKCDYLEEDQIEEAIEYIAEESETDKNLIFPISALNYINNDSREKVRMENIMNYINKNIAVKNKELRLQSQKSHQERMKEHSLNLLNRLLNQLKEVINGRDRYRLILDSTKRIVDAKIESMIVDYVRKNLYTEYRQALIDKISKITTQDLELQIGHILESTLPPDYMDKFWNSMNNYTIKANQDLWAESINEKIPEINKLQNSLAKSNFKDVILFGSDLNSFVTSVKNESNDTFKTGLMTSLGIAGAVSAYAALIGPAAAGITLGAAATGIGMPIAIIGVGVSAALKYLKNDKGNSIFVDANNVIEKMKDQYLQDIISKSYIPEINKINNTIVDNLVSNYENTIKTKLPEGNIDMMVNEIEELILKLKTKL